MRTNPSSPTTLEDAIRKELREINDAVARHDAVAVMAHFADGEGMYYAPEFGRMNAERYKNGWREAIELSAKRNEKVSDEITNLYVLPLGPDTALANYVQINKTTVDGKNEILRFGETDIFVLRNGRWLIRASHSEILPKEVEPVVAGLPLDWQRSTNDAADSYAITVDTKVRRSGKASVSIRFLCGSDAYPWAALTQKIDAAKFKGKRVRLTGWIKTADVGEAALWMRADGEDHELAFDNMSDRSVKGTTGWKQFSVVLDIPEITINLIFGTLVTGKGQAWTDDLMLEIVDKSVPVTVANKSTEYPSTTNLKRVERSAPVNLGFEGGAIK